MEDNVGALLAISGDTQQELRKEARKRKIEQMKLERTELLYNKEDMVRERKKQQQRDALSAAESITDSLRRTKQLLERELERSGKTLEKLSESNKVIASTLDEQHAYKDEATGASNIRKKMKRREFSDLFFIGAGVFIYISVIFYILICRFGFLFSWILFWM